MQFRDMAKAPIALNEMLQRTEQFLLDQRDGKGGFSAIRATSISSAERPIRSPMRIVWALTESGVKDNLDGELTVLRRSGES